MPCFSREDAERWKGSISGPLPCPFCLTNSPSSVLPLPHHKTSRAPPERWQFSCFLHLYSHEVNRLFDAPAVHWVAGAAPTTCLQGLCRSLCSQRHFLHLPMVAAPHILQGLGSSRLSVYPSSATCSLCEPDQIPILCEPVSSSG